MAKVLKFIDEETTSICGTPNYIPPEMVKKQAYGIKADIWAFGCIVFALISGGPPFDCKGDIGKTLENIRSLTISYPQNLDSNLQDLFYKIFEKDPKMRYDIHQVMAHKFMKKEQIQMTFNANSNNPKVDIKKQIKSLFSDTNKETALASIKNIVNKDSSININNTKQIGNHIISSSKIMKKQKSSMLTKEDLLAKLKVKQPKKNSYFFDVQSSIKPQIQPANVSNINQSQVSQSIEVSEIFSSNVNKVANTSHNWTKSYGSINPIVVNPKVDPNTSHHYFRCKNTSNNYEQGCKIDTSPMISRAAKERISQGSTNLTKPQAINMKSSSYGKEKATNVQDSYGFDLSSKKKPRCNSINLGYNNNQSLIKSTTNKLGVGSLSKQSNSNTNENIMEKGLNQFDRLIKPHKLAIGLIRPGREAHA